MHSLPESVTAKMTSKILQEHSAWQRKSSAMAAAGVYSLRRRLVDLFRRLQRAWRTVRQVPGLPDFSWHNIPNRGQAYQIATTLPNDHRIYKMAVKYSKWPQNTPTFSLLRSWKIYPNLVWKYTIWQPCQVPGGLPEPFAAKAAGGMDDRHFAGNVSGANPTIASCTASAVKIYRATSSLARFKRKTIFFCFERSAPVYYNPGVVVFNSEVVGRTGSCFWLL
jgi:hypothetical protein